MSACDIQYWSGVAASVLVLGLVLLGAALTLRAKDRQIAQLIAANDSLRERLGS